MFGGRRPLPRPAGAGHEPGPAVPAPAEERLASGPAAGKLLYAVDAALTPASPVADIGELTALSSEAVAAGGGHVLDASHVVFPNGAITLVLILAESHLAGGQPDRDRPVQLRGDRRAPGGGGAGPPAAAGRGAHPADRARDGAALGPSSAPRAAPAPSEHGQCHQRGAHDPRYGPHRALLP